MLPTRSGAFNLFKIAGIEVSLHWSWFVVGAYEIQNRRGQYSSLTWNVLEYLTLFFIVLLHEFGHSLACRQVGGQANEIILWPLGGVAYVAPPPRPGATLWSIAAGPLVNVVLLPVTFGLLIFSRRAGWDLTMPDVYNLIRTATGINLALLVFNILPIYPLDGGQILRSLLWFWVGPIRSLLIAQASGLSESPGWSWWRTSCTSHFFTSWLRLFSCNACGGGIKRANTPAPTPRVSRLSRSYNQTSLNHNLLSSALLLRCGA